MIGSGFVAVITLPVVLVGKNETQPHASIKLKLAFTPKALAEGFTVLRRENFYGFCVASCQRSRSWVDMLFQERSRRPPIGAVVDRAHNSGAPK